MRLAIIDGDSEKVPRLYSSLVDLEVPCDLFSDIVEANDNLECTGSSWSDCGLDGVLYNPGVMGLAEARRFEPRVSPVPIGVLTVDPMDYLNSEFAVFRYSDAEGIKKHFANVKMLRECALSSR